MSATLTYIRTYLSRIVIIVVAIATLAGYFTADPTVGTVSSELNLWNMIITSFTLFVGLITIFVRYGKSVFNRTENWMFHLYCLVMILIWIPFGFHFGVYSNIYQTAYMNTKITLHIAILGLLIFFCVSAMYRTMRIKSFRTAVFAFLTVLLVFINAPYIITPFPQIGDLTYWLLDNPQMAGARAMVMCGGIGGVILGIRILLGHERGAMAGGG